MWRTRATRTGFPFPSPKGSPEMCRPQADTHTTLAVSHGLTRMCWSRAHRGPRGAEGGEGDVVRLFAGSIGSCSPFHPHLCPCLCASLSACAHACIVVKKNAGTTPAFFPTSHMGGGCVCLWFCDASGVSLGPCRTIIARKQNLTLLYLDTAQWVRCRRI